MGRNFRFRLVSLLLILILTLSPIGCTDRSGDSGSESASPSGAVSSSENTDASEHSDSDPSTDSDAGGISIAISDFVLPSDSDSGSDPDTDGGSSTDSEPAESSATASQSTSTKTDSDISATTSSETSVSSETETQNSGSEDGGDSEDDPAEDEPFVPLTPVSDLEYYGRVSLDGNKKLLRAYDRIAEGVSALQKTIDLRDLSDPLDKDELERAFRCYYTDYPQHFWVSGGYSYEVNEDGDVLSLKPTYFFSSSQIGAARTAFENAVAEYLSGLSASMSEYALEKEIHDRLILGISYCKDGTDLSHTAYGALVSGKAVCDGYSRAFLYLCRCAGISATVVTGVSKSPTDGSSEPHAWNLVKIDGAYYYVDVTWDDAGEPDEDLIHYAYFNVTDEILLKDHSLALNPFSLPVCTATAANYFVKNGADLSSLTVEGLASVARRYSKGVVMTYRCASSQDPVAWINDNISALIDALSLRSVTGAYFSQLGTEARLTIQCS